MPISDDVDVDLLLSRLSGPLPSPACYEFRIAAENALMRVPCPGEGIAYRVAAALVRNYFVPIEDRRAAWDIAQELPRGSKLASAPPLEYAGDQRHVRYRRSAR